MKTIKHEFENSKVFTLAQEKSPIMEHLQASLIEAGTLKGLTIGWNCHLTSITALAANVLLTSGVKLFMSECNESTSEDLAVEYMQTQGATIFRGKGAKEAVLSKSCHVISDTGLDLISTLLNFEKNTLKKYGENLAGACEITTSGITRLRKMKDIPFPVINLNDGIIKSRIENFHGVGEGMVEALDSLSGADWRNKTIGVVGYGNVGAGTARYLKQAGAGVVVAEIDPVKSLLAHYDGFSISTLNDLAALCPIIITATGQSELLDKHFFERCLNEVLIVNAGHWADEINLTLVRDLALEIDESKPGIKTFLLKDSCKKVSIALDGNPANVVLLTGSIEPTLLHLTSEILSMAYLVNQFKGGERPAFGELKVPDAVEYKVGNLALKALGCAAE